MEECLREYRKQSLPPLAGFWITARAVLDRLDSLKDS